jgi:hypothetical protein
MLAHKLWAADAGAFAAGDDGARGRRAHTAKTHVLSRTLFSLTHYIQKASKITAFGEMSESTTLMAVGQRGWQTISAKIE